MTGVRPANGEPRRILYVEDNDDARELTQMFLESHGYEVTAATTSASAFDTMRTERFDLVISDYNLPDEDGITMLARAAAEGLLHCESIIVTGSIVTPPTPSRVLHKPVDPVALLAVLDSILAPARTSNDA